MTNVLVAWGVSLILVAIGTLVNDPKLISELHFQELRITCIYLATEELFVSAHWLFSVVRPIYGFRFDLVRKLSMTW